ncbi:dihydrofolate reductase family protein [Actinoplanes sp. NPDC023714]|uniref:RibD family protein n=1 Tax=Actinoplanes sp. NPDC023714 TaxID=3154322 RepID=UPI0033C1F279
MGVDGGRPRVVVSVTATADGRVAPGPDQRLLEPENSERWRSLWPGDVEEILRRRDGWIAEQHRPRAILEGSGTFVAEGAGPRELPGDESDEDLGTDYLPKESINWFVVVDGRGRIEWTYKQDGNTTLLVLVSKSTPREYLAYLRREEIPYLVAGTERVDLAQALTAMREKLGVECVLSQAGGGLTSALIRNGLVDELHVVTIPAVVGGLTTPSIVDGPAGEPAVRLRTVEVVVGEQGTLWTHYEVAGP